MEKNQSTNYNSEFELIFNYRPHEGVIPKRLESDLHQGNRWALDKLDALFRWMLDRDRKENLYYDATRVCNFISKKIERCHSIRNKSDERSINYARINKLRDEAVSSYLSINSSDRIASRVAMKTWVKCSWMLHDYFDLADILEDIEDYKEIINQQDYKFIRSQFGKFDIPTDPEVLRHKHRARQSYRNERNSLFIGLAQPLTSLEEVTTNAMSELKARSDVSDAERLIESSDAAGFRMHS